MNTLTQRTHVRAAAAMALAAGLTVPLAAQAREFVRTEMELDIATGESQSQIVLEEGADPVVLLSASDITDGAFTYLDLKVVLSEDTKNEVEKMVDQGFTAEPSGCAPGQYGPLDMEDGLRYFFDISVLNKTDNPENERVRGTIYPGNRSTHWLNDVFCEHDSERGDDEAIMRVTGYYYVIHRNLRDAIDIQLRAVTLTEAELVALQ